jgi:phage baseplate assembly protein W
MPTTASVGVIKAPESRVGTNRVTGKLLTGFAHVVQSLWVLFTTRVNTRVMRLRYGSDIPGLIDHPGNRASIALLYSALVSATIQWEPGFRFTQLSIDSAGADGHFVLSFNGIYYPRGHLGDYSVAENATLRFLAAATANGLIFTGTQAVQ